MDASLWSFPERPGGANLAELARAAHGFDVETPDGLLGTVDEGVAEVGRSYLVVDTGPPVFGTKLLLPAGLVEAIDVRSQTVLVRRTTAEIEGAPGLEESLVADESYYESLEAYYGGRPAAGRRRGGLSPAAPGYHGETNVRGGDQS